MVAAITRGIPSVGAAITGPVLPDLVVCIDRATARQPANRFPTAAALRDELMRLRPYGRDANDEPTLEARSSVPAAYAPTENALTLATGAADAGTVPDLAASTMPLVAVRASGIDTTVRLPPGDRGSSPSFPPVSLDRRASPTPTAVPIAAAPIVRTQPLAVGQNGPLSAAAPVPGPAPSLHDQPGRSSHSLLLLPSWHLMAGMKRPQ